MKSKVFITIGIVMILMAFGLTGLNLYQDKQAEKISGLVKEEIQQVIENKDSEWKDTYEELPNMEMPVVEMNGHFYIGTLDIPKFKLSLPIMSESSKSNLLISPCRTHGSVYTNDMVIAGHNFRSHFSKLKKLSEHDEIIFTDMDGNVFKYELIGFEVLQPTQVEEMNNSEFDLSLYTCTYGGKTRLALRCLRTN